MGNRKSFNLFIYGTLMNRSVFRAVLGRRLVTDPDAADGVDALYARPAVLNGYKKISPDNTYLYAVPDRHGRIRGHLVGPLPIECMGALRQYEGRNYSRRTLRVQTADGAEQAVVFVGNVNQWEHSFGYEFRDRFKQEVLLEQKIDAALLETEREQLHTEDQIARRAVAELRGATIRDLVRRHFDAGGISDYAIRHSLKDTPLHDFSRITGRKQAQAIAPNYLGLVVRQVIFNELEERLRRDFRYELDHIDIGAGAYERTVSSLAALRILNASDDLLDKLVGDCLKDLSFRKDHLVDFVKWAIVAADGIYQPKLARQQIDFIRNHAGHGHIPLGAELEFSNIGHGVIRDPQGESLRDEQYDGFLYFSDFGLDTLTWKLGGHIDDHREKVSDRPRRGFFEVALGSLSIRENLSKPITADPWLLGQFIHEARRFYRISPHSVHISLQLRRRHLPSIATSKPVRDRLLPLSVMKCLFAIAGDSVRGEDGLVRINRLVTDEIVETESAPHILFSEISIRRSSDTDEFGSMIRTPRTGGKCVQQFRFLRLSPHLNYEPIIVALKGLQLKFRPGSFLTAEQYASSRKHRKLFTELLEWGANPQPIPKEQIRAFCEHISDGLMTERRGKPAHSKAYIAWSLSRLRAMLRQFNALLAGR